MAKRVVVFASALVAGPAAVHKELNHLITWAPVARADCPGNAQLVGATLNTHTVGSTEEEEEQLEQLP